MNKRVDCDWKGAIRKRFRWVKMRFDYVRYCYRTNCMGDTLASWWEWEDENT